MSRKIVFDAYALLDLLEDGAGANEVAGFLSSEDVTIYLSTISLGEVYYIVRRRRDKRAAEAVIEAVLLEETIIPVEATWPRIKAAAALKAEGGLSYADCFVLALAKEEMAPVVTGDPEIIRRARSNGLELIEI